MENSPLDCVHVLDELNQIRAKLACYLNISSCYELKECSKYNRKFNHLNFERDLLKINSTRIS